MIFRTLAGDLCFAKLLNYFCSVIGLPSLICGQFLYRRLVDKKYGLESVLVLLFLSLCLPLVKLKHQEIASISSCVLAIAVHTAVFRIPAVLMFF